MAEKFKTAYGVYPKIYSPLGCDQYPEYAYVKEKVNDYDAEGKKIGSHDVIKLKCVGSHSINEQINSYRSSTELKEIYKKFISGDTSVLMQRIGEYVDSVGCPETLLDAQLMMKNGEMLYDQLPTSIKEMYDNDVQKFIDAAVNGKLKADLDLKDKDVAEVQKSQASEIEQLRKQIADLTAGGVNYEQ